MTPTPYCPKLLRSKSSRRSWISLHSEPDLPPQAAVTSHYPISPATYDGPSIETPSGAAISLVRGRSKQAVVVRCIVIAMAATAIGAGWSMLCAIVGSLVLSKQKQYRDDPNSPTYDKVADAALFGMSATGGGIMALIVCALLQWIGLRADIALLRTGKREESMSAEETSRSEDIQGNLGYCIMIAVVIIGGLGQAFGVMVLRTVLSGGYNLGPAVNTSAAGMMIIYASIAGIYVIVNLCGYFFDC